MTKVYQKGNAGTRAYKNDQISALAFGLCVLTLAIVFAFLVTK
jgi:hypothetical protein